MSTDPLPWQAHILAKFPRAEYVPIDVPDLKNMWRHATWEAFVYDTLVCYGTQMATLLSMAYQPKVIVEMGLDAGFTTLQFCKLNPEARVYGIDLHADNPTTGLPIAYHARRNNAANLTIAIMPSWEFALPGQVDLCFIDGEHIGDAPWKDTLRAWENRNVGGDWCIAWDDCHPNVPDVYNAVNCFVAQVGMELHQVGSWYYIGSLPHSKMRDLGCST